MMATAAVRRSATQAAAKAGRSADATTNVATTNAAASAEETSSRVSLQVGWAVRNRAGQVVVIYEGVTAQAVAQEWASDRDYTVEPVTL